jgi:hypothetical protein
MSAALIETLAAADCFQPAFALDQLSERHVDFDVLVGGQRHEHALAELLVREQPTRIAISGPAGSGKSSLIAATLAQLPTHLPLPIGIAMADLGILENQTNFAQFILAEILRQARDQFTIQNRIRRAANKIERAAADETTHSSPHLRLSAKVTLPVPAPGNAGPRRDRRRGHHRRDKLHQQGKSHAGPGRHLGGDARVRT